MARQKKISKGQIINSIKAVADALQDDGTSISEVYRMMLGQTKPAESMLASFLGKSKELYKGKDLIEPDDIKPKRLFFDEQTNNEFENISNALSDSNFYKLQRKLEDNAMPTGITAIFYGQPGTGKTEMANQIARSTGRMMMHVDISRVKSCYYGETEKIIKEVFDKYRELCKTLDRKPILLFNEADAIFSRRQDVGSSNLTSTENAVQNIILEEMERFDGILIATTNLIDSLDPAFERRFLYKVRFGKPSVETKMKIWGSKMPQLSPSDIEYLARTYDLSGGEIDNIVRKTLLNEIVGNISDVTLESVVELCDKEKAVSGEVERKVVGFR